MYKFEFCHSLECRGGGGVEGWKMKKYCTSSLEEKETYSYPCVCTYLRVGMRLEFVRLTEYCSTLIVNENDCYQFEDIYKCLAE